MRLLHPRLRQLTLLSLLLLLLCSISLPFTNAWEWSDWMGGLSSTTTAVDTLSLPQVQEMRVRDLKRRLARHHGYSADEIGRMIHKKELVETLAFEEEKIRVQYEEKRKRQLVQKGILVAIVAVLVVMCWPLLSHAYEVIAVNVVVYTDRKRHEASKCWELQSYTGMLGVALMCLIDGLQFWMSASILLSWVMTRNRYFFPIPSLSLKPGQFMGPEVAKSSIANYGINVGPMVLSWGFRWIQGQLERFTGRALAKALRAQRQAERANETPLEKANRRAARQQAKRERTAVAHSVPPAPSSSHAPPPYMQSHDGTREAPMNIPMSAEHDLFLRELEQFPPTSEGEDDMGGTSLDDLD
jgi:hypothetical protein